MVLWIVPIVSIVWSMTAQIQHNPPPSCRRHSHHVDDDAACKCDSSEPFFCTTCRFSRTFIHVSTFSSISKRDDETSTAFLLTKIERCDSVELLTRVIMVEIYIIDIDIHSAKSMRYPSPDDIVSGLLFESKLDWKYIYIYIHCRCK
jgi:hypothetical protein